MEEVNVAELVNSLNSNDDGTRKKAAFRLQSMIADPSFADSFLSAGGMPKLQHLALNATGNTLAYSLASFSNMLGLDQGWDLVNQELIERLVQLIVSHPLVNILRGAMSILAAIVSHPHKRSSDISVFGLRALQPALETHPNFLEMLVSRLSSDDHALCANALQLINALMRDSILNGLDTEWPKFVNRLQDLGVIKAVYVLMQGSGLQDLAHSLLEFQSLTKMLLRKWREVRIDMEKLEHRRALRAIYVAGNEERRHNKEAEASSEISDSEPDKWRRLGFETETPALEFEDVGYLGMVDLTDFARKSEDGFRNLLLEQSNKPANQRCPAAKASLAVTSILFDHFEVDRSDSEDQQRYVTLDARSNFDKVFKPLLLQWSRLHTSGLQAFFRLWATTGAEVDDFTKIEELVRILIEHVVGLAPRTRDVQEVEQDLANYELRKLRELQMELLELTHEDAWGQHLRQIKDDLRHEALQFIKEQRIRCLLQGSWFPNITPLPAPASVGASPLYQNSRAPSWRFVRLSHNRRYLHFADFDLKPSKGGQNPSLDLLENKIDLTTVTSVVSNISPSEYDDLDDLDENDTDTVSQDASLHKKRRPLKSKSTNTTITIHGYGSSTTLSPPTTAGETAAAAAAHSRHQHTRTISSSPAPLLSHKANNPKTPKASKDANPLPEMPLLTLHPQTSLLASEWLDGLLLLLNQAPITAETNKLVGFIAKYGLRIRLLNVRFEEGGVADAEDGAGYGYGYGSKEVEMPSREGVDDEFFYDVGGGV